MMESGWNGSNEVMYLGPSFWLLADFLGSSPRANFWESNAQDGFFIHSLAFQLGWLDQLGVSQSSLSLLLFMEHLHVGILGFLTAWK